MEISQVLQKFKTTTSQPHRTFLALNIGQETVTAAVWQVKDGAPSIISHGSSEDWDSDDKLIPAADASLSTALENFEPEPNQVVLGLPPTWVTTDKINPDRQTLLKDLSTKLAFKAIGFVISTEATCFYLKSKEGTPPTAVLLELSSTDVLITLVKLGKIISTHKVGRSDDLGADVQEGLARFDTNEPFPSRFIIFDGHLDLESARQTLLSYPWPEKLSFLHFPKIELLEPNISLTAVVQAAANELTHLSTEAPLSGVETTTPASVGFYPDQPPAAPPPPPQLPASPAGGPKLPKLPHLLSKLTQLLPRSRPPTFVLAGVAAAVLSLILFLFLSWWLPKATVTLYLSPATIDKTIDTTITTATPESNQILGRLLEAEVEDTLETPATGTTEVGDKAKGEVTLFNKTTSTKKFVAGTTLVGPNNLEFTLDGDVTIASQSATDTGITFGKANAPTTATSVGTASNIPQDSNLTVKGFDTSSFSAKAATSFTGGTSREVKSVSSDDQDRLLEEATTKLTETALDQLKGQVASDQVLIDVDLSPQIITKKFTHAVGEEADSFSLNLKVRVATLVISKADLVALLQGDSDQVPAGFVPVASAADITIESADITRDTDSAEITAKITTKLIPNLDLEAITAYLMGKSLLATETYLKALPNFSKVDIDVSPHLPGLLSRFPRRTQNIKIDIKLTD